MRRTIVAHPGCGRCGRRWIRLLAPVLAILAGAGCATLSSPRDAPARRALRTVPSIPPGHLRADRALVAAFFSASGIPLPPAQLEQILPPAAPRGRIDRNAIRRIAARHGRLLMVVKADEEFLWEELAHNLPLLILLPPHLPYPPSPPPPPPGSPSLGIAKPAPSTSSTATAKSRPSPNPISSPGANPSSMPRSA